ncbi:carnitine O-acetyltransferase-like [Perca fluviatilis]|uniref:carnitine O-acetyltransferase-like n=1 Tax=Perca fluviatilis TaxID=8168 RepID=UPI0019625223|nr:carnitine O-acetyltransferase-like [Perca fluviatilis]
MLRICSRALVKVGMVKPWQLLKPVSSTLVAGRNLSRQKELPKMPVPPLQQTCELYLSYVEPMVEPDELRRTKELVEEFRKAGGVGERLQRGLERKADNTENWLSDHYVITDHLSKRTAILAWSGVVFPRMDFRDKKGQIRCAAQLITAVFEFKTMIDNGTLPAEYIRGKPLCMKQYEQILSSCTVPGLEIDSSEFYAEKHITVVHNCQFFVLDMYNRDGTPLTVDQLCVQLDRICNSSLQNNMEPIGILATEHRDIWGKTYIDLIKDKTNKESVLAIQSSIFTVCLDGAMPPDETFDNNAIDSMLHGGGSQWNSGNRWFDKGLQIIIGEDGLCGITTANATADGVVVVDMCEDLLPLMRKPQVMQSPLEPLPEPQRLHFNITPELKKDIEEAKRHLHIRAQSLGMTTTVFKHFGKNLIKAFKLSPDAFVQMAIQLAYYRIHQQIPVALECVSMRTFRLGRLGFTIINLPASVTFVKAFDDPNKQNSEKVDLLEKAIKAHQWHTNLARDGHEISSHLWALKMQAVEEKVSMPEIFTDSSFYKTLDKEVAVQLYSSQVYNKAGCRICFSGEPGRYELLYGIKNDNIELQLPYTTLCNTCKDHRANGVQDALIDVLQDALLDLRTLLEHTTRAEANPDLNQ